MTNLQKKIRNKFITLGKIKASLLVGLLFGTLFTCLEFSQEGDESLFFTFIVFFLTWTFLGYLYYQAIAKFEKSGKATKIESFGDFFRPVKVVLISASIGAAGCYYFLSLDGIDWGQWYVVIYKLLIWAFLASIYGRFLYYRWWPKKEE